GLPVYRKRRARSLDSFRSHLAPRRTRLARIQVTPKGVTVPSHTAILSTGHPYGIDGLKSRAAIHQTDCDAQNKYPEHSPIGNRQSAFANRKSEIGNPIIHTSVLPSDRLSLLCARAGNSPTPPPPPEPTSLSQQ